MAPVGEAQNAVDLGWPALLVALVVLLSCLGGLVTAAKGRWGWLAAGLLTGGAAWIATAFLIARPDSAWAQLFYGPPQMARAKRASASARGARRRPRRGHAAPGRRP